MQADYWARNRLNRRRALIGGSGLLLGAAGLALAGCGGGSDSDSSSKAPTLLNKPTDTTKSAKRGGTFSDSITSDGQYYAYDINLNAGGNDGIAGWVYSRFVKAKVGTVADMPDGSVEGDFCNAYEVSADGLQVTFKVRPGTKWDSRSPTNGRAADSQDVKFSWDRWARANAKRGSLVNQIDPEAPVVSVTTPDDMTVVMKLAFPSAPLLPLLSYSPFPVIMPREADGGFDPRSTGRGSAAWQVTEHLPSNVINVKRNPDWYNKEQPYIDGWTLRVIPDYSQGMAQFKAGNLDTYAVRQEDILTTKKETPSLVLSQRAQWRKSTGGWFMLGQAEGSPLKDERVRQALSMSIDRQLWLDVFSDKAKFEAGGLPVQTRQMSFVGPAYDFYLDPTTNAMGDAGKAFKFNPAEAKKLLSAAGHTVLQVPFNVVAPMSNEIDAIRGGVTTIGDIKLEPVNQMDLGREFVPRIQNSKGNFAGVGYTPQGDHPDPDYTLFNFFHPSSAMYVLPAEDRRVTQFIVDQRRQLDRGKRADILKEFQKYMATKMYAIPLPGDIRPFQLSQPWVGNFDYFVSWVVGAFGGGTDSQTLYTQRWLDASKRPA